MTSTETTNLPAASLAAKPLRSASGVGARIGTASAAVMGRFRTTSVCLSPSMRLDFAIQRTWSGVVPQQPPTMVAPSLSMRRANTPKCSGVAT